MDSNAHSSLRGHSNNSRGSILTELISEYGLLLRNIGKDYTYDCQLGKSVIDLTLTCNLGAGILDWRVSRALNFSDHNTITFNIATEFLEMPPTRPWAKADWLTFEKELEDQEWTPGDHLCEKKLNLWVNKLTRDLTNALNKACPLKPSCTINKNNPWFTPQLKQLRKEVGAAYSKQKDNSTENNKEIYKNRLKRYKRLLLRTKKDHHAKYVDSIKTEEEMSHFVKGLLKQKTAAKPSTLKKAGWDLHEKSRRGPTRTSFDAFPIAQTNNTMRL